MNELYVGTYTEINLISIGVLLIIIAKEWKSADTQKAHKLFIATIFSIIALLSVDIVWVFTEFYSTIRVINIIVNSLYTFIASVLSFLWLLYINEKTNRAVKTSRFEIVLSLIPVTVSAVLSIGTPWTGWLFYIDDMNVYHRGMYNFVQLIVCYGYLFIAATKSIYCAAREKNREKRREYALLASFVVLPTVGALIQTSFYGLPVIWPAASVSILIIYLNIQTDKITTDGLTGLRNRRQLDRHLFVKAGQQQAGASDKLYLLLMDIDNFKTINDTFGHLVGDRALIVISDVLTNVCGKQNAFVARFGGDEFAVVIEAPDENNVLKLQTDLKNEIDRANSSLRLEFILSLSIGYAVYNRNEVNSVNSLISRADADMYRNKQRYKLSVNGNNSAQ